MSIQDRIRENRRDRDRQRQHNALWCELDLLNTRLMEWQNYPRQVEVMERRR